MPHNFFRKRACIEARDHGEPSRAVKSAGAAKRNNWRGPRERSVDGEEAVYAGFALLLTERRAVVSSRGASVRLWGRVDSPRQDRKALRKPGVSVQEGRLRRFGLEPRKPDSGFAGWGFLLVQRRKKFLASTLSKAFAIKEQTHPNNIHEKHTSPPGLPADG
jgi:hypothetical protein